MTVLFYNGLDFLNGMDFFNADPLKREKYEIKHGVVLRSFECFVLTGS